MNLLYEKSVSPIINTTNLYNSINLIISDPFLYHEAKHNTVNSETITNYASFLDSIYNKYNLIYLVLPYEIDNSNLIFLLKHIPNIKYIFYEWYPSFNLYFETIKQNNINNTLWVCSNSLFNLDFTDLLNINFEQKLFCFHNKINNLFVIDNIDINIINERLLQMITFDNTLIEEFQYLLYLSGYGFYDIKNIKIKFENIIQNSSFKPITQSSNKLRILNNITNLNNTQLNNILQISNDNLYQYISKMLDSSNNFIIPRISLNIESQCILLSDTLIEAYSNKDFETIEKYNEHIKLYITLLKYSAGIYCSDIDSLFQYYHSYITSFEKSNYIIEPEVNINSEKYCKILESIEFIKEKFSSKEFNFYYCLQLFNHLNNDKLWLNLFNNKNILIISENADLIEKNIDNLNVIYNGFNQSFFHNCNFKFIKVKNTKNDTESNDWMIEYKDMCDDINKLNYDFDIALVSASGFSNPLLEYIYSIGKSAINVGSIIDLYFGIVNKNEKNQYNDVIGLFSNDKWIEYK